MIEAEERGMEMTTERELKLLALAEVERLTTELTAAQATIACYVANLSNAVIVPGERYDALEKDSERYRWLRSRDLDAITKGGVFAGMTPRNVVLNGEDLDAEVDAAMLKTPNYASERPAACGRSARLES